MNDKNCVTKVEIFVDVKSYLFHFGKSCKRANDATGFAHVRNTVKLSFCHLFTFNNVQENCWKHKIKLHLEKYLILKLHRMK